MFPTLSAAAAPDAILPTKEVPVTRSEPDPNPTRSELGQNVYTIKYDKAKAGDAASKLCSGSGGAVGAAT